LARLQFGRGFLVNHRVPGDGRRRRADEYVSGMISDEDMVTTVISGDQPGLETTANYIANSVLGLSANPPTMYGATAATILDRPDRRSD